MLAEILVGALACDRVAQCPRCGSRVWFVVHPAGPLVCMICQREFELGTPEANTREGPVYGEKAWLLACVPLPRSTPAVKGQA